jgi:DNA-binding protein HU-beta
LVQWKDFVQENELHKTELIAAIATKAGLTKVDAERAVNACLEIIQSTVASGGDVVMPGFGTFRSSPRAAREGRNPQTGQPISIPATTVPAFSAGKTFKEAVAAGAQPASPPATTRSGQTGG